MTFLKIYLAVSVLCFILNKWQAVVLRKQLEKEVGHPVRKNISTLEYSLVVVKMALVCLFPVLRLLVTGLILFSEDTQEDLKEKMLESAE